MLVLVKKVLTSQKVRLMYTYIHDVNIFTLGTHNNQHLVSIQDYGIAIFQKFFRYFILRYALFKIIL